MRVIVTPKAVKQYEKLPRNEQEKIKRKMKVLELDPLAGKKLEGELSELRSLKAWPYRVLYYLNKKENKIFITSILHRQGAYK